MTSDILSQECRTGINLGKSVIVFVLFFGGQEWAPPKCIDCLTVILSVSLSVCLTKCLSFYNRQIYVWSVRDEWELIASLSGTPYANDLIVRSPRNLLRLQFISDNSGTRQGFQAIYSQGESDSGVHRCSRSVDPTVLCSELVSLRSKSE